MDFDRLCACYGVEAAPRAAEGLFDVSTFSKVHAAPRTLGALTRLFADCYAEVLEDAGVRFCTRELPGNVVVNGQTFYRNLQTAFGGYKDSGVGREGQIVSLLNMTQIKNVVFKNIL